MILDKDSPQSLDLVERVEFYRLEADRKIVQSRRLKAGQFMTPAPIARFMASLFNHFEEELFLLDPGAGVGSLTAAFLDSLLKHGTSPTSIVAHAYEVEDALLEYLSGTSNECQQACAEHRISFHGHIHQEDFIRAGAEILRDENGLFSVPRIPYTHCIVNPPYRKIRSDSPDRAWLRQIGIETTNLYTGFLAIAIKLLAPGGELVAIVPRSFCNGVYFKPFREFLLREMALKHLHVFEARDQAFKDNDVLQENIILYAVKCADQGRVVITSSYDPKLEDLTFREVTFEQVVNVNDPHKFINIATSELDQMVIDRLNVFVHSLEDLGLSVSTGPVVDFRLREAVRPQPLPGAHPLIYPAHFTMHWVDWPKAIGKKANAILETESTRPWLMPNGWYVLTRRFSSKEERKRIIAALHDPRRVPGSKIGFENHVNVFHRDGAGLEPEVAKGLALYLNSTLVDLYFRQFSGHTQVNAADLRTLHYPSLETLVRLGQRVGQAFPDQQVIDNLLETEIVAMTPTELTPNPVQIQRKIQDALTLLRALGLPKAQLNERSALTLLALLGLKPGDAWANATSPLMGITPIMDFVREHYGRTYAPNTRETFRRFTMHQFVQAGIAVSNPDRPDRPTNSPKSVYQIAPNVLALARAFGNPEWETKLTGYLEVHETLAEYYAKRRKVNMIPLVIRGKQLALTPGAHSQLIKAVIEEFGPRFVPGAEVLYIGDTGSKMVHFDEETFKELGRRFAYAHDPLQRGEFLGATRIVRSMKTAQPRRAADC